MNDERYSRVNIRKAMKKKKEKKKSNKDIREEFVVISGKRKIRHPPSDIVTAVNDLIRQGFTTSDAINGYFATKSKKLNDNSRKMYLALVNSKIYADNIRLTDNITNNPLHCYLFIQNFKTKTLSNDILWLNLLNKKSYANLPTKKLYDISTIDSAWFGSEVYRYDDENVLKGYYQDFDENFAMIGANGLKLEEKYAILNKNQFNFELDNVKYDAYGDPNVCVIVSDTQKDDVKKLIENTVEISSNINGFDMNEKKIELKECTFKYVDCLVKPETFCPAFLIMPKERDYAVTIKMNIDYNKFFSFFLDKCKYGSIECYDYLIYWDTLNYFFDFAAIFTVTAKDLNQAAKNKLKNFYNTYNEYKPMIELWKFNQLKLQKIAYTFYHAFAGKINYDKLRTLNNKLAEYIEGRNKLVLDNSYKPIKNFFLNLPNCIMIKNQFSDEIFAIPTTMKKAIENLMAGGENIVKNLRVVGTLIYKASLSADGTEGAKVSFPFSVAPGVFLGDLWDNDADNPDILARNVESFQEQVVRNEEALQRQNDELLERMDAINDSFLPLLRTNIQNREQELSVYQLTNDEQGEIENYLLSTMSRDNFRKTKLDKEILSALNAGKDPKEIVLPSKYTSIIDNYINKKKLEKEKAQIQHQSNINNAQTALNNAVSDAMETEINTQTQTQTVSTQPGLPGLVQPVFVNQSNPYVPGLPPPESFLQGINTGSSIRSSERQLTPSELIFGFIQSDQDADTNDTGIAKLYSDIVYLSGRFRDFKTEASKYNGAKSLYNLYKLSPNIIDSVVKHYNLNISNPRNYQHVMDLSPEFTMTDEKAVKILGVPSDESSIASTTTTQSKRPIFFTTKVKK
jgi:hypothetical protein